MAEYTGKLKDFSALDLGALASRAAMARTGVAPEMVDHVVFGNVLQTSTDAVYGARHVGLKAGVPIEVPALTVNRLCGSGIQSAISGGQMILLGEADVVLAGGTESMSQAPHVIRGLAQRPAPRTGAARGLLCGRRSSTRTAAARWPAPPRTAPPSTASRAKSRIAMPFAASSSPTAAWKRRPLRRRSRAGRDQEPQGRRGLRRRRSHAAGFDDGRAGEAAGGVQQERMRHRGERVRHSRRRRRDPARLGARCEDARPDAARAPDALGDGRRRPVADGNGPGACHAQGAREGGAHARRTSTSSRSTRRSRRSIWRSKRSWASIATR